MQKTVVIAALTISLLMIPFLVYAEVYKWVDEKGTVHFTDEYSNIPEKYLPVAETQWLPKESSLSSMEEKPTPALAPKSSEPLTQGTLFSGVISKVDNVLRTIVVTDKAEAMVFPVSEDTRIKTDYGMSVSFSELKNGMSVSVEYFKKGDDIHTLHIKINTMRSGFGKKQKEKQEKQKQEKQKEKKR